MKRCKISMLGLIVTSFILFIVVCEPPGSTAANPGTGSDSGSGQSSGECDRKCLIGVLNSYLDALVACDPSLINAANTLKYTDNGVEAQLGEGLWQTAARVDNDKRLDFADPVQGNVASQVVIYEEGSDEENASGGCGGANADGMTPVIYQVRLKVEQRKITEIEAMTVRRKNAANGFFNVKNMAPEPVFLEPVPPEKRMSREEMKAILDLYVDYLDGDKTGKEVPFDQNCKRYENGFVTAAGLASFQMQSWFFNVTRRYPVIDEETGIIWGVLPFFQWDYTLVVGEAFKIVDGKIMMIQAVMNWQPAKAWESK